MLMLTPGKLFVKVIYACVFNGIIASLFHPLGTGLGAAYINYRGEALEGDSLNGMEAGHMPFPIHLFDNHLGLKKLQCGCGRDWGCVEAYTSMSGLPQLLQTFLLRYPDHHLNHSPQSLKQKAFSLRGLAQCGDLLALAIFDLQARALGLHMANLLTALDCEYVVIGGGLMDPESMLSIV